MHLILPKQTKSSLKKKKKRKRHNLSYSVVGIREYSFVSGDGQNLLSRKVPGTVDVADWHNGTMACPVA